MSPRLMEPILGGLIMVSGTFEPGQLAEIGKQIIPGGAKVEVEAQSRKAAAADLFHGDNPARGRSLTDRLERCVLGRVVPTHQRRHVGEFEDHQRMGSHTPLASDLRRMRQLAKSTATCLSCAVEAGVGPMANSSKSGFARPAPWAEVAPLLVDVATGRRPADLVVRNGRWVNVHSGEVIPGTDLAIVAGRFAYCGPNASHAIGKGTKVVDAGGRYLVPGLCDGHMHVESGMVTVTEFCRAVIPHGTTSMFIDPHEIANVLGLEGVRLMHDEAVGACRSTSCRDAVLRAVGARAGECRRRARRRGCRRGDDLAEHHRARRGDEFPGRRRQRSGDGRRDRRDGEGRQDGRRPLRLARPRAGLPWLCRRRPGRRPRGHPRRGRHRARAPGHAGDAAGWARPGTTSPPRSRR